VVELADKLRQMLAGIRSVTVHDTGVRRCGIVTFAVEGHRATDIASALRAQNVNVWVSPREYARFDMEARGLSDVVRASVHYYNTEDELDRFGEVIASLIIA
jgi:selenocysteine lyase/cysteine desulfurase